LKEKEEKDETIDSLEVQNIHYWSARREVTYQPYIGGSEATRDCGKGVERRVGNSEVTTG
jgi:hypothetical protein